VTMTRQVSKRAPACRTLPRRALLALTLVVAWPVHRRRSVWAVGSVGLVFALAAEATPAGAATPLAPPSAPGAGHALVTSASASPPLLPASGGVAMVTGTVANATTCQLELLSTQGFPVVYSRNPRNCAGGGFTAKVVIGPNPTLVPRTIAFALVAANARSSYAGRFYLRLLPAPHALVTSASASPPLLPASGGVAMVTGTVANATTCQLELFSTQGFPVVYSRNPRNCAGGTFTAKVVIGPNPTRAKRVVAFALVASNLASSFAGKFFVALEGAQPLPPPGAPPQTTTVPSTGAGVPLTVSDSSNWSGYAVAGGPYSEVRGTFTVPSIVSGAPLNAQVSQWVGLDGTSNADPSLIQAGVNESPDPQSASGYDVQAWWEILPASETDIATIGVRAGDEVTVTIWQVSAGTWKINVTDDTNGESFTTPDEAYHGPGSSAEWIVEATTECQLRCRTASLAPYTPPVSFTDLGMTGPKPTSIDEIVLMQGVSDVATPSPLSAGAFRVSYTGPPPNNF
jgi:hypothetical protein